MIAHADRSEAWLQFVLLTAANFLDSNARLLNFAKFEEKNKPLQKTIWEKVHQNFLALQSKIFFVAFAHTQESNVPLMLAHTPETSMLLPLANTQ